MTREILDERPDKGGFSEGIPQSQGLGSLLSGAADKTIVALGLALFLTGVLGVFLATGGWAVFFDNLHSTAGVMTGAALAWLGVRSAAGFTRAFRLWFAAGLTAYSAGQLFWDVQVYAEWYPAPSPSDLCYVLVAPCFIVGYYVVFRSNANRVNIKAIVLDAALLSGAAIITTYAMYLSKRGDAEPLLIITVAMYPIVLLTATAIGLLLILHYRPRLTPSQVLHYLSMAVSGWMALEYYSHILEGIVLVGDWVNIGLSFAAITMGIGARNWRLEETQSVRFQKFCSNILQYMPLGAVVAASAAVVLSFVIPEVPLVVRNVVVLGGGGIILLATVRQSVLVRGLNAANYAVEAAKGELERYSHTLELNIAERERTEQSLRREKENIRHIIDSTPSLICGVAADGTALFVNQAVASVTGYSENEVLITNFFDLLYPGDNHRIAERLFEMLADAGSVLDYSTELITKSGESRAVVWSGSVISDEHGGIQHILLIGNDITERLWIEGDRLRLQSLERQARMVELRSVLQSVGQLTGPLRDNIYEVLRAVAETLGAVYASYWESTDAGIVCTLSYSPESGSEMPGEQNRVLLRQEHQQYFDAVQRLEGPLVVPAATIQPEVLDPQNLTYVDGMIVLDTPIHIAGQVVGVLCVGIPAPVPITVDDASFLNRVGHLLAHYVEIDGRRLASEELRQSEERFARAFLDSPLPMLVINTANGRIIAVNEAWSAAVGYSAEEAVGRSPDELKLHALQRILHDEYAATSSRNTRIAEALLPTKSGDEREYQLSGSLINIAGEECLLLAQQDITERKRAEAELRSSEEFLRRLLQSIPDSVYILSLPDYRVVEVNNAYVTNYGVPRESIVGKTSQELTLLRNEGILPLPAIEPESYETDRAFKTAMLAGEMVQGGYIVTVRMGSGRKVRMELSGTTVTLRQNQRYICIFERDVTDREIVADALRSAKIAADRANRAKSEFLANMSHEIRTPMNAILGFTEILREQVENPRHRGYLETINTSSKTLLSLINDILDLSKIEEGKMEIQYEPVDIRNLIREVGSIFAMRLLEKHLRFNTEIAPNVASLLYLDEVRLRQVLFNLVGNAVKFTEHGHISVTVTATPPFMNNGQGFGTLCCDLMIEVADTGFGIPQEQVARIFEPFQQQDGQSARKYGGTGLGLTITRRLTEMMNGGIAVESTPEAGSAFRISFSSVSIADQRQPAMEDDSPDDDIFLNGVTVLVVDDVAANRELLSSHLGLFGANVVEAENGLEAINRAERCRPAIIFMDVRMPVMNGQEAAGILRKHDYLHSVPIIAVTASVLQSDAATLTSLFDGYINKPFSRRELVATIRRVAGEFPSLQLCAEYSVAAAVIPENDNVPSSGDLRALDSELAGEFIAEWSEIRRYNRIAQIREFARRLRERADFYRATGVVRYADALGEACTGFDVKNVAALMARFPEIARKHSN